jgi:hypothetical protein
MLFCPGMEPFGHRESSLFAEPTENKSFSEKNPVFFSTKLEMIPKLLNAVENRHSGQAKRDPESRIFKKFWIPAFAGMTK